MRYIFFLVLIFSHFTSFACTEVSNVCVEGPATKNINGRQVHRACWKYETQYECYGENYKDACDGIAKNCTQINSVCISESSGRCLEYKRTYTCDVLQSAPDVRLESSEYVIDKDYLDDSHCNKKGCGELESVCVESAATRNIGGKEVYKSCWAYQKKFLCASGAQHSDCAEYSGKCKLQASSCISNNSDGSCVHTEKRYSCLNPVKSSSQCRALKYCIGDKCEEVTHTTNNNMHRAIAGLSVINGIGKDVGKEFCNGASCDVFKGASRSCKINPVGTRNCCKNNGWALDVKLASCGEEEKMLAKQKDASLCHFVGSYCAKKLAGFCIQKKQSYCCFNSKIARIIQEQGRRQLGITWGDPKAPNCQSLSIEQIQKLDFSHIDLSELYGDINQKLKVAPDAEVLKKSDDAIRQKMEKYYAK